MRILVLTIFLTLLNNVRASCSGVSFSSNSVTGTLANNICSNLKDWNRLTCGNYYYGNGGGIQGKFKFFETSLKPENVHLGDDADNQDGWNGNKFEYLHSSGTLREFVMPVGERSEYFYNPNFDFISYQGKEFIAVRYTYNGGESSGQNKFRVNCRTCNANQVINSQRTCSSCSANSSPNADQTACVCDTNYAIVDGSCQTCPTGSKPNSDGSACVCDTAYNYASIDGSCQTCPENSEPNTDGIGCKCSTGFIPDGNGGCLQCPSGTVVNTDQDGCICDTSQSLYGNPSQCETRADDCTQLHNSQYPMLMEVDGVCLQLTRNTQNEDCSDTTKVNPGTDCIYKGPDIATGFRALHISSAFLMQDPPPQTFTVTSDANTELHVRLFYHRYRFTCVQPSTNCFEWKNMETSGSQSAFYNQGGGELDLSGGIEGGTVVPYGASPSYQFNRADYYNMISVKVGSTLKIEKLDANCAKFSALPVSINPHFCECLCEGLPYNGETPYSCQDVDSILNSQLCYTDSNGQIQQMPIQEVQAIQTSILQVQQTTGECPLNV